MNSLSEDNLFKIFKAIQSEAPASVWSQGVTLSRSPNNILFVNLSDSECFAQVKTPGKALSHKVKIWPEDNDWDCDCGADLPCQHIAAAAILMKRGDAQAANPHQDSAAPSNITLLEHHFIRTPGGLGLVRKIRSAQSTKILDTSLLAYMSGVQSKRLNLPEVVATKTDYAIDQILRNYRSGAPLERPRIEALFRVFSEEQKFYLDGQTVQTSDSRLIAQYECIDEEDGYRLRKVTNPLVTEVFPAGVALCTGNILRLLNPKTLNPEESKLVEGEGSFWPKNKEHVLFSNIIPQLQKKISLTIHSQKRPKTLEVEPRVHLLLEKEVHAPPAPSTLSVLANIVYGEPPVFQLNPATFELSPISGKLFSENNLVFVRNQNLEKQLLQKLSRELNLQIGRRISLSGSTAIDFVKKASSWNPEGDGAEAFSPELRTLDPVFTIHDLDPLNPGKRYSFEASFCANNNEAAKANFAAVFKSWQAGVEHVPLMDGSWAKIPREWMLKNAKRVEEFLNCREAHSTEVPTAHLPELAKLCDEIGIESPDNLNKMKAMLDQFEGIKEANLPDDLTATLRPYQKRGVNWLCFLRDSGLGAMLADDMGLGKTLQMLCAIQGKTLIVAPTSVLLNWSQEIKKFRPKLNVCLYYGTNRALDQNADVTLTTYGVLRLDQHVLTKEYWDSLVLDEAQTIKNPDSLVAKAAHALKGEFRAALSGTPVENRLDDLWSQFQFLNPGFLGSQSDFQDKYGKSISSGDKDTALKLKSKIKPFILRRLKRDVAPELPPRIETVLRCELREEERLIYETILASTKKEVIASLETGSNVMKALEVILRLRQACCHPSMIPGSGFQSTSSKTELLIQSLENSLSEGHKSLVFSQWTSFLDLIGKELNSLQIPYSRIDGSTSNRQNLVNEFQSKDGPPIMLISLKAGGVGLTLTAADHVFITDPWWNPAAEDQAADRAHRIGQTNTVMIHRLVASDTIEERILLLQEAKKDLARAILEEGAAAASTTLTKQDLLNLFL